MKTISFSCVEKLPSLLDKSCSQTIRPAWKDEAIKTKVTLKEYKETITTCDHLIIPKPPRFKVGDEVQLYWKMRSKYKWFCRICGKEKNNAKHNPKLDSTHSDCLITGSYSFIIKTDKVHLDFHTTKREIYKIIPNVFNKLLGTAKITEVFEIIMSSWEIKRVDKPLWSVTELAKRDGFKDYHSMKKWFDKYDLSTPKRFYVYRWAYQKGSK